jgi:iron uptake system EfeUOB component EfeO/EfeM
MKTEHKIGRYLAEGKEIQLATKFKKLKATLNSIAKLRTTAEDVEDSLVDMFDAYDGYQDFNQFVDEISSFVDMLSNVEYNLKNIRYPKVFK